MRKKRVLRPGVKYHVYAKINRSEHILMQNVIKTMFISVIKRAKRKYSFSLINFVIMSNHIHFLIKPGEDADLSKIMQWILSVFAVKYNKRLNIHGHVWQDRFKSKIIENIRQYLYTYKYICENPVKANICKSVESYSWTGLWFLKQNLFDIIAPPDDLVKYFVSKKLNANYIDRIIVLINSYNKEM